MRQRDVLRWYRERPWRRPPGAAPAPRRWRTTARRSPRPATGDRAAPGSGHATFAVARRAESVLTDPHSGARALLPRRHVPPGIPLEAVPRRRLRRDLAQPLRPPRRWTVERLPAQHRAGSCRSASPTGSAPRPGARARSSTGGRARSTGASTITCLPSQHWSRRIEQRRERTLWCAWLIDSGGRRYFFAGDTGYFPGFAEFGRRFGADRRRDAADRRLRAALVHALPAHGPRARRSRRSRDLGART